MAAMTPEHPSTLLVRADQVTRAVFIFGLLVFASLFGFIAWHEYAHPCVLSHVEVRVSTSCASVTDVTDCTPTLVRQIICDERAR